METTVQGSVKDQSNRVSLHIADGQWYRLKIVCRGFEFAFYIDGKLQRTWGDQRHNRGKVGLGTWVTRVAFRNLHVTDPNGKELLHADLPEHLPAEPVFQVNNFQNGEIIRYHVPLLQGYADAIGEVHARNLTNPNINGDCHVPIVDGQFKALVELVPGLNQLELTTGDQKTTLALQYISTTSPYIVNVIYAIPGDSDERYPGQTQNQEPFDDMLKRIARDPGLSENQPSRYLEKIDTMVKMMQSLAAEWMAMHNLPRKTFNLRFDKAGRVRVYVLKHPAPKPAFTKGHGTCFKLLYNWIGDLFPIQITLIW